MLRRNAVEQVGLFDIGYFFFAEEMDLCYRLRRAGWTIAFVPAATIIHLGGQSAARVPWARVIWHYSGLLRFYRLHRGRVQYLSLRAIIALSASMHLIWLLARHRRTPGTRQLLAAYAKVLSRAAR
jgi:GT2 family glycosyltransferase